MLLGMAHWASGDLEAARQVFADYTLKLRTAGNISDAISTTVVLADIGLTMGRLREAIITIEQLFGYLLDKGEQTSPETADLHRELSELYLEQGNLVAAAEHLRESKALGEKAELPVWRYRWCIAQARLVEYKGDLDGALARLDEAEHLFIRTPLPSLRTIPALKARIRVKQGRLTQASEWVREQGLSPDNDLCYLREFEYITLAKILIAQYQIDHLDDSMQAAMRLLDHLQHAAEEGRRLGNLIEILVLQACALQIKGNSSLALAPLERALTLAEPEGYVRMFVDEGKPMAELLTGIKAKNGTLRLKQFILQLVFALDEHKEFHSFGSSLAKKNSASVTSQPLVEPLSGRELEVLKLLRSELSGPEIAREFMLSLSTIRTHTQRIYAKLGVNNRRAAVRRAEELDLL